MQVTMRPQFSSIPTQKAPAAQVRLVTLALQDESLHDKLIAVGNRTGEQAMAPEAKALILDTMNL